MAEACPLACKKETIDTDISFTLMSEESARRAFRMWGMPANRTKDDVVFMELFFKTLDTEVCSYLKQKEWGDFLLHSGYQIRSIYNNGSPKFYWRNSRSFPRRKHLLPLRIYAYCNIFLYFNVSFPIANGIENQSR